MASNTFRARRQLVSSVNNENPVKNIKNNLVTNRKQSALKVLTNTVQSTKRSDGKSLKQLRVMPMQKFETETKCHSPLQDTAFNQHEEFDHFGCVTQEKDFLPSSMTCNIGKLSDFFSSKSDDEGDWFIDDYNNIMNDKIKDTFEQFGEPKVEHCLPSLPVLNFDFSEVLHF